jgi:murein DD-endopeptidase MepM/ murein hydrolase activator NlpD/prophage tail gpP-like protein
MDYFVDSALDTDTDSWQVTIGDFSRSLIPLLHRDTEVRCSFFIEGEGQFENLHSGLADEVAWNDEGTMIINGRDFTSIATDSRHPPQRYTAGRPHVIVAKEAAAIKMGTHVKLAKTKSFKQLATDGSESYWQFWYRLYRKRQMWLWAEPDGTLVGGLLNYNVKPSYYFGDHMGLSKKYERIDFIPVEGMEWRANKNQRVAEVFVIGNRGDKVAFVQKAVDPLMKNWLRRPLAIVNSKGAHGPGEAHAEALEEIFESKVGATEIMLTVANPGGVIRQNRMAFVNIAECGIRGEFFVVGAKTIGSVESGLYQQVRLRERNYAISKRIPTDPQLIQAPGDKAMYGGDPSGWGPLNPSGTISEAVSQTIGKNWGEYFVAAADKNHGPWPFGLFLGTLISICDHETKFRNIRYNGMSGPDYPGRADGHIPSIVTENAAYKKFVERYANDPEYGLISAPPGYQRWAVGPMQLFDRSFKEAADRLGGGSPDELVGGRWNPRHNIMEGGAVLRGKLKGFESVLDPGNAAQAYSLIWQGVAAYGGADHYGREIKAIYDANYNQAIDDAIKSASATTKISSSQGWTFEFARQATGGIGTNLGGPAAHLAKHDSGENWESNNAYDVGVPIGTSIYALEGGEVGPNIGIQSSRPKDGNRLTVGRYWYAHLSSLSVRAGQNVDKGQLLGKSGASQNGAAHLHVAYNNEGV